MRDYGTIDSGVWKHPDFKPLSDAAKTLFAYLKTCDHGNLIGCFHIPLAYIQGDLKWTEKKCKETLSELLPNGFVAYCETTEYVLIHKQIEKLPFQNENQAKAALKLFSEIPKRFTFFEDLRKMLLNSWDWDNGITAKQTLYKPLINRLQTVTEPLRNSSLLSNSNSNSNSNYKNTSAKKFTDEDLSTATWMYDQILIVNPEHKTPDLEKWADEIRLMRDKRTPQQIRSLFAWANQDNFWRSNILSPGKLRQKWDQLTIRAQEKSDASKQLTGTARFWADVGKSA